MPSEGGGATEAQTEPTGVHCIIAQYVERRFALQLARKHRRSILRGVQPV